jgi:hypothetical protein
MLISHRYRFIYLKTVKTAGTSLEIALEELCWPVGGYPGERHGTPEVISEAGIVGARLDGGTSTTVWYNHMPAAEIRDRAPREWRDYLKICAIRNPFDKVVSLFWFQLDAPTRATLAEAPFDAVRQRFSAFVETSNLGFDRDLYMLDGQVCVDVMVRYEHLDTDYRELCEKLGVSPRTLGDYKRGLRQRAEPYAHYYDDRAIARVAQVYDWELANLGYGFAAE